MQSIFLSSSVTVNTSSSFLVYCLPIIKNKTQRAKNKAKRNKWQLHLPTLLKGSKKYIYKLFLLQISFQIKTGGFNLSHMVCKALEFLDVFYFLKFFRVSDVTLRAPIYCKKHLLAHLKSSCWQTKNTLIICRNILFEYNAISQDLQWTWNYFQGIYKNNSLNNLNEVTKSILTLNNSFYSELKLINTEPIPVSWSGGTTSTKKLGKAIELVTKLLVKLIAHISFFSIWVFFHEHSRITFGRAFVYLLTTTSTHFTGT